MIKENIEAYQDGKAIRENELATVVAYCESAVIYQDDNKNTFFLIAELPEVFEIGTVAPIFSLQPVSEADDQLKENIFKALEGGD